MLIDIEEALIVSRSKAMAGDDSGRSVWAWAVANAFKEVADAPRSLFPALVDIGMIDPEGLEFHSEDGVA